MKKIKVDFSNPLKNHKINNKIRTKMVDWIVEVFGNFPKRVTDETFFRAVCIMDLYFKKKKQVLCDNDVHITGIVSMFLSSKYEDVIHITLQDMVNKVGHNKFSA
jgi:hypothetical protein